MSSTNRIIIPVVGSKHNLQEQNVFKHANLVLTPQKDQQQSACIAWKKSQSAFKKFKQKRDRKEKKEEIPQDEIEQHEPHSAKIFFKLVQKRGRFDPHIRYGQLFQNQQFLALMSEPENKFYDPNQAPLYMSNQSCSPIQVPKLESRPCSQMELMGGSLVELSVKKEESEPMEEEYPLVMAIEPLSDDPFIIVRKSTSKKSCKSSKSKLIRKQIKFEKLRSKQSLYQNSQLQLGRALKKESLQNDPYLEGSPERFQKCNQQIMTLQQIVKSANQKHQQQQSKKTKIKDSPQPNESQKQASQRVDPD